MNSAPTQQLPPQPSSSSHGGSRHAPADSDISLDGLAQVRAVTVTRDDEKGLGFTVAEGERGDRSIVIVTSVIPGGPADQV